MTKILLPICVKFLYVRPIKNRGCMRSAGMMLQNFISCVWLGVQIYSAETSNLEKLLKDGVPKSTNQSLCTEIRNMYVARNLNALDLQYFHEFCENTFYSLILTVYTLPFDFFFVLHHVMLQHVLHRILNLYRYLLTKHFRMWRTQNMWCIVWRTYST